MTERTVTPSDIKSYLVDLLRAKFEGAHVVPDFEAVECARDPEHPDRLLCEFPVWDPTWEDCIRGTFYVTPETPIGCRR